FSSCGAFPILSLFRPVFVLCWMKANDHHTSHNQRKTTMKERSRSPKHSLRTASLFITAVVGIVGQANAANWVNNGTYPWGSHTHNGNAYMKQDHAWFSSPWWYLRADQPGEGGMKYRSGVIYLSDTLKLRSNKAIGAQCYINTDAGRGIWPAFWITTLGGWTGEVDIAEWKGSGVVWQNTYDGGWETKSTTSNNSTYKTH